MREKKRLNYRTVFNDDGETMTLFISNGSIDNRQYRPLLFDYVLGKTQITTETNVLIYFSRINPLKVFSLARVAPRSFNFMFGGC